MKQLTCVLLGTLGLATAACQVDYVDGPRRHNDVWISSNSTSSVRFRAPSAASGTLELTDDDRDVRVMPPGASLEISSRGWLRLVGRRYTVRVKDDGTIVRRYRSGLMERRIDGGAEAWIGDSLERFTRSGFGAESRVARLVAYEGPAGVISEVPRLSSDHARAKYLKLLVEKTPLDGPMAARALQRAGDEIQSDSELAGVLIAFANTMSLADEVAPAFIGATDTIRSDHERAKVLTTVSATQTASVALRIVHASVDGIQSKHERARVMAAMSR